jgi:hypothetical protein
VNRILPLSYLDFIHAQASASLFQQFLVLIAVHGRRQSTRTPSALLKCFMKISPRSIRVSGRAY